MAEQLCQTSLPTHLQQQLHHAPQVRAQVALERGSGQLQDLRQRQARDGQSMQRSDRASEACLAPELGCSWDGRGQFPHKFALRPMLTALFWPRYAMHPRWVYLKHGGKARLLKAASGQSGCTMYLVHSPYRATLPPFHPSLPASCSLHKRLSLRIEAHGEQGEVTALAARLTPGPGLHQSAPKEARQILALLARHLQAQTGPSGGP